MKKYLLSVLLGAALLALGTSPIWAEDVLVTKAGKKYHHVESSYAQKEGIERISLEEAKTRGLEPSKDYLKRKSAEETQESK